MINEHPLIFTIEIGVGCCCDHDNFLPLQLQPLIDSFILYIQVTLQTEVEPVLSQQELEKS